ncbi:UPF0389 protein CG9231-like [Argiope bruennichi]|uniref:UPF0389 protein GA21628 like protein n=1 Tax=Argiope bruennichi TaxID=94029 RepID=A0A8T0E3P3_ARGBR|nr:UPF0389 protein CG9231-like [Argiope bruennichi]KAF8764060.1 UPF0389 protein GA21628 like protein [Argiope bruennichi]
MALRLVFNQRAAFSKLCCDELINKSLSPQKVNVPSILWMSTKREATHRPNLLEKYLLVWMKKYPSVAEVPKYVTPDLMEKVRNKSRIKLNIIFCFITAFVCIIMVYRGKKAAERGESLRKMNIQWHEEQNAKK